MEKEDNLRQKEIKIVRTRFAPSPTGPFHIGNVRTALFNYIFAKQNQGIFILRIEDTDRERSKLEYEKEIIETLDWLGIHWDEGPYKQSDRVHIYTKYLKKLLDENKAYYCFCPEQELEDQRQYQLSIGEVPHYTGKCANLSKEIVEEKLAKGIPSVIRFRVSNKKIKFNDLIRGKLEFDTSLFGDIIIAKNLTTPLYNFTVVVDDFEMKITHVFRGEDHISNTPKQILIQEALEFTEKPIYAHLPLILGSDRAKLSKRHGALAVSEYKKQGYLPETIINFIAFLGWNPGNEKEIFSLNSLIKEFSINKVQKGGAIFNINRLNFLNGFYIRQKSLDKLTNLCLTYLIERGLIKPYEPTEKFHLGQPHFRIIQTNEIINFEKLEKIISLYQERLKKLSEICDLVDFFFKENLEYDKNLLKWKGGEEMMSDKDLENVLLKLEKILLNIKTEEWIRENLEKILLEEARKFNKDRGYFLWPLRVALSGKESSAGPFEIAEILGKEKTLTRIKQSINKFVNKNKKWIFYII